MGEFQMGNEPITEGSETIIKVCSLTKKFGHKTVLEDLNFTINKGEIFGLLGPNGAGKSTFISILTTISRPTSGDIMINSDSVARNPERVRKDIGLVPQETALYQALSGFDNLSFWAGIYGLRGSLKKERIREALSVVKLEDRAHDKVSEYSGGMKRRLNIAVALLHHPGIMVMDEPTAGVDIQSRRYVLEAVKALKENGRTVVFTSHYVDEMELICDRMAIMEKGYIKAVGTAGELKAAFGCNSIEDVLMGLEG
jgi:ABC-2 type transport system ATP-binding protein